MTAGTGSTTALIWFKVEMGVLVSGMRVPVDTSMLAANAAEVQARCTRVAEGMGGVIADTKITEGLCPVTTTMPAAPGVYLPPPCTYKAEERPDKIDLNQSEGYVAGWEEFKDVSPGIGAFLGGPKRDQVAP